MTIQLATRVGASASQPDFLVREDLDMNEFATHQYHTGYPDESLLAICTCPAVRVKAASKACGTAKIGRKAAAFATGLLGDERVLH